VTQLAEDYYATLDIPASASDAEVKAAYRRRSRLFHPDRNPSPDATRRMAALNEAYTVLANAARRAAYDRDRPSRAAAPRPAGVVPAGGRGAFQPDRLPDWYEFLDLHMNATVAVILRTAQTLRAEIPAAHYAEKDEERLLAQLRTATTTLTDRRLREIYDKALSGRPPAAGTHPDWHEDYYSFLGISPGARAEVVAERVTALSEGLRRSSAEFRELMAAWQMLRDPERRRAYDAALAAGRSV